MEDSNNMMIVICDVNPSWWAGHDANHNNSSSFNHCMESLLVFCNSYLMINHTNELAFIACHTNECRFVYPNKSDPMEDENEPPNDGKFEVFVKLNDIIMKDLQSLVNNNDSSSNHAHYSQPSLLAGALTKALCYIHSYDSTGKELNARIFILKGSPDASTQYMSIMNCIFAAQKKNIVIDSCSLGKNSGFLQQASDITNGTYFNLENISAMLEYLIWMFLPEPGFRDKLHVPSTLQIDYRAACFCHKQLVDVGFVCSVCLSIYCQFMPKCLTCQTRFKLPQLPAGKAKKKKKEVNTS